MRIVAAIGLICLASSSPAAAMPNAFWIFGFHVPGKAGPRSDVVLQAAPKDAVVSTSTPVAGEVPTPTPSGMPTRTGGLL